MFGKSGKNTCNYNSICAFLSFQIKRKLGEVAAASDDGEDSEEDIREDVEEGEEPEEPALPPGVASTSGTRPKIRKRTKSKDSGGREPCHARLEGSFPTSRVQGLWR
jgi:hypothetical protein